MKKLYTSTLIALFAATFTYGDLIQAIGNLTTSDSTSTQTYSSSEYFAGAFHTGTHPTETGWNNFTLTLKVSTHGSWPSGKIELWHADTDGIPTTRAKSYELPATQPSDGLVTVGSPGAYKIYENTDYAIIIHATEGGSGSVIVTQHTTDDDPGTAPGWVLGKSVTKSSNGGSTWDDSLKNRLQMAINVDVIPEPSVQLLILTGGGFVFVSRRWRTRAKGKQEEIS